MTTLALLPYAAVPGITADPSWSQYLMLLTTLALVVLTVGLALAVRERRGWMSAWITLCLLTLAATTMVLPLGGEPQSLVFTAVVVLGGAAMAWLLSTEAPEQTRRHNAPTEPAPVIDLTSPQKRAVHLNDEDFDAIFDQMVSRYHGHAHK